MKEHDFDDETSYPGHPNDGGEPFTYIKVIKTILRLCWGSEVEGEGQLPMRPFKYSRPRGYWSWEFKPTFNDSGERHPVDRLGYVSGFCFLAAGLLIPWSMVSEVDFLRWLFAFILINGGRIYIKQIIKEKNEEIGYVKRHFVEFFEKTQEELNSNQ